jgi:RNA polymerase sigma-32 factor
MASYQPPEAQQADSRFIRDAMREPMLTREAEAALARRWTDEQDPAALQALVTSHMRLAVSMAAKYRGYGLAFGDLIQQGNMGLMTAAMRFDPDREVRFATYAVWWIRAAIQDFVLRNWSMVRLGTTAAEKSLFFNLRRLRNKIAGAEVEIMSDDQRQWIADQLDVDLATVESMEARLAATDQSGNAPIGQDGDAEWQDLLVDGAPSPEDRAIDARDGAIRRRWLDDALATLPAREELILRRRYMTDEGCTLEVLGRQLGVTKERVRQLEKRALDRVRDLVQDRDRPAP